MKIIGMLILLAAGARAENWVKAYPDSEHGLAPKIDVDGITKDKLGFLHYNQNGDTESAVDCTKRVMYLLGKHAGKKYAWKNPDWLAQGGHEVIPGSDGARITDFVCAQGPAKKTVKRKSGSIVPAK